MADQDSDKANKANKATILAFNKFMESHVVAGKGIFHTHTNFGPPWKKYNIESKDYDTFLDLYSKVQLSNKVVLNVTERPQDIGPLLIDIDLKFDKSHKERQYSQEDITQVLYFDKKTVKGVCF